MDNLERLVSDLRPVRPQRSRGKILGIVLGAMSFGILFLATILKFRADLALVVTRFDFFGIELVTIFLLVFSVFQLARETEAAGSRDRSILFSVGVCGILAMLNLWNLDRSWREGLDWRAGFVCAKAMLVLAMLAATSLVLWSRSRAPTRLVRVSLWIAAVSLFAAYLTLSLHCGITNPSHLATYHVLLPASILLPLLCFIGLRALRY